MNHKWLFLTIIVCGCFTRHAYITEERFKETQIGDPIALILEKAGDPYAIYKQPNGEEEYEYIENFSQGTVLIYENHYFFVIKDGKVIEKRMTQKEIAPYDLIYQDDPNHHYYP